MHEAWSAASSNGGLDVNARAGRRARRCRICRPSSSSAPVTKTSARSAAVTQGMAPSSRKLPGPISVATSAWAPSRREVVSWEMPTVAKALPARDRIQPVAGPPAGRPRRSACGRRRHAARG